MVEKPDQENNSMKRRQILASMGGVAGASLIGTGLTSARTEGEQEYIGISYETVTETEQGPASAQLNSREDGSVEGFLWFAGYTVPVGSEEPLKPYLDENGFRKYKFKSDDEEHLEDGEPLVVKFEVQNEELVAGFATRRRSDFENLGFALTAPERLGNGAFRSSSIQDKIASGLNPNSNPELR